MVMEEWQEAQLVLEFIESLDIQEFIDFLYTDSNGDILEHPKEEDLLDLLKSIEDDQRFFDYETQIYKELVLIEKRRRKC